MLFCQWFCCKKHWNSFSFFRFFFGLPLAFCFVWESLVFWQNIRFDSRNFWLSCIALQNFHSTMLKKEGYQLLWRFSRYINFLWHLARVCHDRGDSNKTDLNGSVSFNPFSLFNSLANRLNSEWWFTVSVRSYRNFQVKILTILQGLCGKAWPFISKYFSAGDIRSSIITIAFSMFNIRAWEQSKIISSPMKN